jgi:hypothetical protein
LSAVPFSADFKLDGDEKIGSHDTWKIEGTVKESEGKAPATSKSIYWVDKTDGSMVKETSDVKDAPFGNGQTGTGTLSMLRTD